jgi:hypothetical protein
MTSDGASRTELYYLTRENIQPKYLASAVSSSCTKCLREWERKALSVAAKLPDQTIPPFAGRSLKVSHCLIDTAQRFVDIFLRQPVSNYETATASDEYPFAKQQFIETNQLGPVRTG